MLLGCSATPAFFACRGPRRFPAIPFDSPQKGGCHGKPNVESAATTGRADTDLGGTGRHSHCRPSRRPDSISDGGPKAAGPVGRGSPPTLFPGNRQEARHAEGPGRPENPRNPLLKRGASWRCFWPKELHNSFSLLSAVD